jgi:hypothetical protein
MMQHWARHAVDIGETRGMESRDYPTTDSRRHERSGNPALSVTLHGRTYTTADWSMGGVLIEGYDGVLTSGALLTVEEMAAEGDTMTPVAIRARVSRVDTARRRLVVNFLDVDDAAYQILRGFMARRTNRPRDH